ncbi:MAG: hypothetical protein ABMA14_02870 [Hyphomonadaceae bacterium]
MAMLVFLAACGPSDQRIARGDELARSGDQYAAMELYRAVVRENPAAATDAHERLVSAALSMPEPSIASALESMSALRDMGATSALERQRGALHQAVLDNLRAQPRQMSRPGPYLIDMSGIDAAAAFPSPEYLEPLLEAIRARFGRTYLSDGMGPQHYRALLAVAGREKARQAVIAMDMPALDKRINLLAAAHSVDPHADIEHAIVQIYSGAHAGDFSGFNVREVVSHLSNLTSEAARNLEIALILERMDRASKEYAAAASRNVPNPSIRAAILSDFEAMNGKVAALVGGERTGPDRALICGGTGRNVLQLLAELDELDAAAVKAYVESLVALEGGEDSCNIKQGGIALARATGDEAWKALGSGRKTLYAMSKGRHYLYYLNNGNELSTLPIAKERRPDLANAAKGHRAFLKANGFPCQSPEQRYSFKKDTCDEGVRLRRVTLSSPDEVLLEYRPEKAPKVAMRFAMKWQPNPNGAGNGGDMTANGWFLTGVPEFVLDP